MTAIRLDAATLSRIQSTEGPVVLCDESGSPIRMCVLSPVPLMEPDLSEEEWERRAKMPGGRSTADVLSDLNGLGRS